MLRFKGKVGKVLSEDQSGLRGGASFGEGSDSYGLLYRDHRMSIWAWVRGLLNG